MLWIEGPTEDYFQMQLDIREKVLELAEDLREVASHTVLDSLEVRKLP